MSSETTLLLNKTKTTKKGDIPTYPPIHGQHRNLVLLFDGTGDTDDEDISNVIALRNMLHPQDPAKQLVFYQPGIGTYNQYFPGLKIKIPLISTISRALDGAIAWSLDHHVVETYEWLMHNYQDGDKVCMFGFSRGAYTARAVSAMVHKVGLLPLVHKDKIWDAYDSYSLEGLGFWTHSAAFRKETESRTILIEFVGVWDTVNSVGLIGARKLHHTASNGSLRTFRHAVALDEHRARFRSNMWSPPSIYPMKRPQHLSLLTWIKFGLPVVIVVNVGGGSVPNGIRPNLAHIALRWMVRECFKTQTGLRFDPTELRAIGIDPESLYPVVKSRPPAAQLTNDHKISTDLIIQPSYLSKFASWMFSCFSPPIKSKVPEYSMYDTYNEEQLDLVDSLAPIYDQLVLNRSAWWLLENLWLRRYSMTNKKMVWNRNLGRGRMIPLPYDPSLTDPSAAAKLGQVAIHPRWSKIRVHRTVKTRMDCPGGANSPQYVPIALLKGETTLDKIDPSLIEWVD